jgi:putative component of membrane protein insertase Oxa1/YidC/SpoIIIJ protein YidD
MRVLALAAIRGYQRWLSPHKGFCCALRVTGGASCSAYGYQVIERFGLHRGLGLLGRRLELCGHGSRACACGENLLDLANCGCDIGDCGRRARRQRDSAHLDALARRIACYSRRSPFRRSLRCRNAN